MQDGEFLGQGLAGGQAPIELGGAAFPSDTEVRTAANGLGLAWGKGTPFESPRMLTGGGAGGEEEREAGRQAFSIGAAPAEGYRGDTARAVTDVRGWLAGGWRVVLVTEGHGPAQRLAGMLRGEGVGAPARGLGEPPGPGGAGGGGGERQPREGGAPAGGSSGSQK